MQISFNLGSFNSEPSDKDKISNHLTDVVRRLQQDKDRASAKNDAGMMRKIEAKVKSGKRLTSKEESYLKEHNPELYMQYLRIRRMAEALEHQLKNADSKEEVNDIIFNAFNSVSDKDPYKSAIMAALDEVIKEFKKSDGYAKLPSTDEDIEEARKARNSKGKEQPEDEGLSSFGAESNAEDDFDAMSWTPLQDVIDIMPTFDMQS